MKNSDFLNEINSKTDNVQRTFSTTSEICGKGNRFNKYCDNIIGKKDLDTIRESLNESEFYFIRIIFLFLTSISYY